MKSFWLSSLWLLMALTLSCATVGEPEAEVEEIVWVDALELTREGQGWEVTGHPYDRLPAQAAGVVRDPVWQLAQHSAGLSVRFVTDSPRIRARWTLRVPLLDMDHMPNTGEAGIDLYTRVERGWRWVGMGRVRAWPTNEATLVPGAPAGAHEYRLYLPLYNGIESVEIGIEPGSTIRAGVPEGRRPICVYGTSITQGGCASRPGMAYPSILGRRLGWPVINLGFSGNGRMDMELADLLGEIDAAVYVLDCGANMTTEGVRARTAPFIRRVREGRPATPIVLIETAEYQDIWFNAARQAENAERDAAMREAFATLLDEGVENLEYVDFDGLIGDDSEGTVDGIHFTDLGFLRMADSLAPRLRSILEAEGGR